MVGYEVGGNLLYEKLGISFPVGRLLAWPIRMKKNIARVFAL